MPSKVQGSRGNGHNVRGFRFSKFLHRFSHSNASGAVYGRARFAQSPNRRTDAVIRPIGEIGRSTIIALTDDELDGLRRRLHPVSPENAPHCAVA